MTAAVLAVRPAALPRNLKPKAPADVVRPFSRDRSPVRRPLVCHWHLDAEGHLVCAWTPETEVVAGAGRPQALAPRGSTDV
jgi:hypothetical protein